MTTDTDILGRPPIMKPIRKPATDDRPPLRRHVRADRDVVDVPDGRMNSNITTTAPVSLPRIPWDTQSGDRP